MVEMSPPVFRDTVPNGCSPSLCSPTKLTFAITAGREVVAQARTVLRAFRGEIDVREQGQISHQRGVDLGQLRGVRRNHLADRRRPGLRVDVGRVGDRRAQVHVRCWCCRDCWRPRSTARSARASCRRQREGVGPGAQKGRLVAVRSVVKQFVVEERRAVPALNPDLSRQAARLESEIGPVECATASRCRCRRRRRLADRRSPRPNTPFFSQAVVLAGLERPVRDAAQAELDRAGRLGSVVTRLRECPIRPCCQDRRNACGAHNRHRGP